MSEKGQSALAISFSGLALAGTLGPLTGRPLHPCYQRPLAHKVNAMRLSPIVRVLVGLGTVAPSLMMLLPVAFMALLSVGLWGPVERFLLAHFPSPTLESIGWNAVLLLGLIHASLRLALLVFYIWHIITNQAAPDIVRVGFAVGLLVIPLVAMTAYWFIYVLPNKPPIWALKAFKPTPGTTPTPYR